MSNSDIMPLRSAVKQILDDFVENYHTNYDVKSSNWYDSICDNWREVLDDEANRCFESIKVKYLLEYGFDEAFALVREFGMPPHEGVISYLYYHVMGDIILGEFGYIEGVVRTYIENNRCDFCGKIDPDTISGGACEECDEKHKDHKEYCEACDKNKACPDYTEDRSCMMCGDIHAHFYFEGQLRCEKHKE